MDGTTEPRVARADAGEPAATHQPGPSVLPPPVRSYGPSGLVGSAGPYGTWVAPPPPPRPRRIVWQARLGIILGIAILVVVLLVVAVDFLGKPPSRSASAEWQSTTSADGSVTFSMPGRPD